MEIAEGLRAFNAWGLYRTVDWKDIEAVQLVSLLGLHYARAEIDKVGGPLWIPLFLARREQFAAMVRTYAGADHPLTKTRWFRSGWPRARRWRWVATSPPTARCSED